MPAFWSDEWFAVVLDAAAALPVVEGVSFTFDVEIEESASGKVRGHGRVDEGRLVVFAPGKFVAPVKGGTADVSFGGKAKRLLPVLDGEQPALVAYMLGELKIDGAYELIVDHLANRGDRTALEAFRVAVADQTDE